MSRPSARAGDFHVIVAEVRFGPAIAVRRFDLEGWFNASGINDQTWKGLGQQVLSVGRLAIIGASVNSNALFAVQSNSSSSGACDDCGTECLRVPARASAVRIQRLRAWPARTKTGFCPIPSVVPATRRDVFSCPSGCVQTACGKVAVAATQCR